MERVKAKVISERPRLLRPTGRASHYYSFIEIYRSPKKANSFLIKIATSSQILSCTQKQSTSATLRDS